ncbi:MAG TPA: hypothetical protein VNP93_01020 [Gaiellaceae bacterium]|nr:hypothetical protein [Gaiellaceae bacterium]
MPVERFIWSPEWHDPRIVRWLTNREPILACAECERKIDREHLRAAGWRYEITEHDGRLLCPLCQPRTPPATNP